MAQPDNLLSSFVVTEKHPATFWLERCSALTAAGVQYFETALAAAVESRDPTIIKTADTANRILMRIAAKIGVTHDEVQRVFEGLKVPYVLARNALAKKKGIRHSEDPQMEALRMYTALHLSCHARAAAILPVLEAKIEEQRGSQDAGPAAAEGAEDEEALFRGIIEGTDTPQKPLPADTPKKPGPVDKKKPPR